MRKLVFAALTVAPSPMNMRPRSKSCTPMSAIRPPLTFGSQNSSGGRNGLDTFQNKKVDLVLLDLLLPQIDGVQLLKRIRSEFSPKELPVLVFTNAYLGGIIQQAWDAGANQVIPKAGVRSGQVIQMIKNALVDPPPAAVPNERKSKIAGEPARKRLRRG